MNIHNPYQGKLSLALADTPVIGAIIAVDSMPRQTGAMKLFSVFCILIISIRVIG